MDFTIILKFLHPPLLLCSGDPRLHCLIEAYRDYGHLKANLDPLNLVDTSAAPLAYPLDPVVFGLFNSKEQFSVPQELLPAFGRSKGSVSDVVEYLEHMYCGTMSLEVAHVNVSLFVVYLD